MPEPRSCFAKRARKISVRKWGTRPNTRRPDAPKRSWPISTYRPSGLTARARAATHSGLGGSAERCNRVGTEAACSNVTLSGFSASRSCGTDTYSAKAPPLISTATHVPQAAERWRMSRAASGLSGPPRLHSLVSLRRYLANISCMVSRTAVVAPGDSRPSRLTRRSLSTVRI